jgi:hypothetical protein
MASLVRGRTLGTVKPEPCWRLGKALRFMGDFGRTHLDRFSLWGQPTYAITEIFD